MTVVTFADPGEFLDDLQLDMENMCGAVRLSYATEEPNDGITHVFVKCGFQVPVGDEIELRELMCHCGDDVGNKTGEGEGTLQAQDFAKYLRTEIESLGVEVRGGSYS